MEFVTILSIIILVFIIFYISSLVLPIVNYRWFARPYEPRYIHSNTPFFGFMSAMNKDPIEFVRSLLFVNDNAVAIAIAGKRIVFIKKLEIYSKAMKAGVLSMEEFLTGILTNGLNLKNHDILSIKIREKEVKQYQEYLSLSEIPDMLERFYKAVAKSMEIDAEIEKSENLFDFTGSLFTFASAAVFFGQTYSDELRNSKEDVWDLLQNFDMSYDRAIKYKSLWRFFFRSIHAKQAKYIDLFSCIENEELLPLIQERSTMFLEANKSYSNAEVNRDVAALNGSFFWAATMNSSRIAAWAFFDLFQTPQAYIAVRQEIVQYIQVESDIYDVKALKKCCLLQSAIQETMRRSLKTVSIGVAEESTDVEYNDGILALRKGDLVYYPSFLDNLDPTLFGPNPYEYVFDRFVQAEKECKNVKLFGYGKSICPGRHLAIHEIKITIIMIMKYMHIYFPNLTEIDLMSLRSRLPMDYSNYVSVGGPSAEWLDKFVIKYYCNLPGTNL